MDINIGVSKFKNMGATCYLNSILHILQEIPEFQDFIITNNLSYSTIQNGKEGINKPIYEALHKLFKLSSQNNDKVIIPTSFKKSIGQKSDIWDGYEQQDSQEFFCFLISSLEEEIGEKSEYIPGLNINFKQTDKNSMPLANILHNIIANKSLLSFQLREYSPLSKMFNGLVRNKKTCSICNNIQYVYEPFITLPLTIPLQKGKEEYTLYDCLNNMIEIERMTRDNKLTCDLCGVKNKFYSESMLWETPNILVIQLKRFINNDNSNMQMQGYNTISHKINNNVSYPLILDMENYFDKNSSYDKSFKYHLIGVNIHLSSGKNINFGHYISFVKNKLNKSWYIYNDENPIREISEDNLNHNNAYILFYVRQ